MPQETHVEERKDRISLIGRLGIDRLKEILSYDPITGIFTWHNPASVRMSRGDIAGSDNGYGYIVIRVSGFGYKAHQLAWAFVHGEWALVDHIDRNKSNNAIANLRKTTHLLNSRNQGVRVTNLLGIKGVQQRGRKFRAYITVNYETIRLGTFDTLEEAIKARADADLMYSGE